MYRLYIYEDMLHFGDSDYEKAFAVVTKLRKAKACSYLYAKDRNQSVIAELLLRYALLDGYSIREMPQIRATRLGKPLLRGENMPCCNISHCDLAVACVVSDRCIGVDVEPYSSYSEEVAREVFNDAELAYVIGSPEHFAMRWTKKESYLKYLGLGLVDDIKSLIPETGSLKYDTYHSKHGYACTVCSTESAADSPCIVDKERLFEALSLFK